MRRKLVVLSALVTALVVGSSEPAYAATYFPGAGYGIKNLSGMTVKFKVPTLRCMQGENDALVAGVISPYTGTLEGWNAAAVVGCYHNAQWSRIQVWVNALGGGHKVAAARPGDKIKAQLIDGKANHPTIKTTNLTTGQAISYPLMHTTTVAAAGTYAGAMVPSFDHVSFTVWANHKPIVKLKRAKRVLWRGRTRLAEPGGLWSIENFSVHFRHH